MWIGAASAHQAFGRGLGAARPGRPLTPGMTSDTVAVFTILEGFERETEMKREWESRRELQKCPGTRGRDGRFKISLAGREMCPCGCSHHQQRAWGVAGSAGSHLHPTGASFVYLYHINTLDFTLLMYFY